MYKTHKQLTIKYFLYSRYSKIIFLSQLRPKGRNRVFSVKDYCFRGYICNIKKYKDVTGYTKQRNWIISNGHANDPNYSGHEPGNPSGEKAQQRENEYKLRH